MKKVPISRRRFIQLGAFTGSGFMLGVYPTDWVQAAQELPDDCPYFQPNAYIRIEKNGSITIFVAKQESGQGVNTSLPMIVAEEMEVDFQQVHTEVAPFGSLPAGAHDTGGSQSVPGTYDDLRKAGAIARTMLINAAAQKWQVAPHLCKAEKGAVVHALNGNRLTYGELACDAALLPVPTEVTLKNVKDFTIIGKEQRKRNQKDILTGKAKYGIDLQIPGMAYAVVARCPVRGGSISSVDDSEAKTVPGVLKIVQFEGTGKPMHVHAGVAVIARNVWAAMKARRMLKIVWNEGPNNHESTKELFQRFEQKSKEAPKQIVHTLGDVAKVTSPAKRSFSAQYAAPFLAHATMEPVNFIAKANAEQCEIWGGLQLPDWAVGEIANSCKLKKENIKVNLALMGGAFGRRLQFDFAIEAVKIAQQFDQAVKVIWDRTDDLRFDNYRPANFHRLQANWDEKGQVQSWQHHVLTTPVAFSTDGPEAKEPAEMLGGASKDFWYGIPNVQTGYTPVEFNIQCGWLRGVEPVVNVFPIECFVDELAQKQKKDPLQFRLSLLEGRPAFSAKFNENWSQPVDPGRLATVLKLAAEKIGWDAPRPKNHFMGIAGHLFFCNSYAAHAIEIEKLGKKHFRLVRIVVAIDCGVVINPDGLRSQMEGGTVFGLGQALRNEITVENSQVVEDSFYAYQLARYNDVPPIEVYTVPSEAAPGGAGEVGVATVAPALCNALAAAGMRPRQLPLQKAGYTWET